jgi:HK97 family phage major capsid protein
MTKELRDLLAKIETAKQEVRTMLTDGKVDDAEKRMEDVKTMQRQAELQKSLDESDEPEGKPLNDSGKNDVKDVEAAYRSIFLRSLRGERVSNADRSVVREYHAAMHEGGVPADPAGNASLVVPQDIQTRINEIQRQLNPLSQYVSVETVNTLSGSRVLEADNAMVPLAVVAEMRQIQPIDNPQFTPVQYSLVKRAGILPITNELIADNDQNLINYVSNWIARKVVVTHNTLITALWNLMVPVPLADLDAIKNVKNVTLDPALLAGSIIVTNQDGYNWLDTQVDGNGRYLLQDDITQPGRKMLFGLPVAVVSNRYLPSAGGPPANAAPILIGNTKQLTVLFTRGRYELASTNVGGTAFQLDTTDLRVITRDDCVAWDTAAAVMGSLAI